MSTNKIQKLNDELRAAICRPSMLVGKGRVAITLGIQQLYASHPERLFDILKAVAGFKDFNQGNDPYEEHDFGSFELFGEKIFWKIDYYDRNLDFGSEDPSDPAKTRRVLTIMLASEY